MSPVLGLKRSFRAGPATAHMIACANAIPIAQQAASPRIGTTPGANSRVTGKELLDLPLMLAARAIWPESSRRQQPGRRIRSLDRPDTNHHLLPPIGRRVGGERWRKRKIESAARAS
jgi:hypothetical protein